MSKRRVAYYYDPDVGAYTYGLGHPMKPHRVRVTHDLISSYGMLSQMHVLRPKRATPESMTAFHTDEYINFLARVTPETAEELTYGGLLFLVGELPDNPPFEGVFEFCSISAGGSIAAAQRLNSGAADIAINWAGGLHHAKKGEASGFCYINDIVLCILELLRTHPRVLYIDIDIHHGDGVEEAFYTTDRVMCASFHKFGEFFPGTGTQDDRGRGKGKGYSLNVPLDDGITDAAFKSVFEPVMSKILEVFRPTAVVLQCGADSLSGDKLGGFNLSLEGHAACVQFMRATGLPLILLGGGGYTVKNVARCWAYETACALGVEKGIDVNLPWSEYFHWFGPRYRLEVMPSNMEDLNLRDGMLDRVRERALEQLQQLRSAGTPSVGMHDVPRESLGEHLGLTAEEDARDELDERLAQHTRYVYALPARSTSRSPSSSRSRSSSPSSSRSPNSSDDDNSEEDDDRPQKPKLRQSQKQQHQRRMSILTNRYIDVPSASAPSANKKRRFFRSEVRWDERLECVTVRAGGGVGSHSDTRAEVRARGGPRAGTVPIAELSAVMERGGGGAMHKERGEVVREELGRGARGARSRA
ncbi:Histone deacetylase [Mycena sanguinolenta]|uniref:histone deacetylase n=1 Tax=Mycena sanguinolenta TaxID=230812 RepID=A0A8H6YSP3_9AGAR|nr:Histone deacetylase [Mycena sanguinolenta]